MPEREHIGWTYRFFSAAFRALFRTLFRLRVEGLENIPRSGGCVLVGNHASFLDPPLLGCPIHFRQVRFMGRDSLFRFPLFGSILKRLGVVPLRRDGGDVAALRTGVRVLREGGVLGLFPEGTRSADGRVGTAKGGLGFLVAHGRVPVVPAYIEGTFRAWPRSRRFPRLARLSITYGDPILPETIRAWQACENPYPAIARRVMDAVAALEEKRLACPSKEG